MARPLDEYEFKTRPSYPWDEWLDGRVWEVEHGKDFTCKAASFGSTLRHAAKKRDVNVRFTVQDRGKTIIFQAFPLGDG